MLTRTGVRPVKRTSVSNSSPPKKEKKTSKTKGYLQLVSYQGFRKMRNERLSEKEEKKHLN